MIKCWVNTSKSWSNQSGPMNLVKTCSKCVQSGSLIPKNASTVTSRIRGPCLEDIPSVEIATRISVPTSSHDFGIMSNSALNAATVSYSVPLRASIQSQGNSCLSYAESQDWSVDQTSKVGELEYNLIVMSSVLFSNLRPCLQYNWELRERRVQSST